MKAFYENLNLIDKYPVENFHSLGRRSTSSKITSPEMLRRHGIDIDYKKHENEFIQNFITDKHYTFVKPKLSKKTAIYLLDFFTKLVQQQNNFKIELNENKSMIFIPPLEEGFEYCVLPSGYHSIKIPGLTKLCDTLD